MLHKQSPRPGAFWAPGRGREGMILPVQSPNSASRRTKKLPPPMTQTKKQQGPGAICSRACCHFLWKKIMLSGRCGVYFLSTASAVTTMKRTLVCFP